MASSTSLEAQVDGEEGASLLSHPECDSCKEEHHQKPATKRRTSILTISALATCFAVGLLVSTLTHQFFFPSHSPLAPSHPLLHLPTIRPGKDPITNAPNSWFNGSCGTNATTARARNCHFNTALHAWLPPSCSTAADDEDESAFYDNNTTTFRFTDIEGKELPLQQALSGERKFVLATMQWHIAHCTYVWQRLHRALLHGGELDSYTADYAHTTHCQEMVLMDRGADMALHPTTVWAKFPTCG